MKKITIAALSMLTAFSTSAMDTLPAEAQTVRALERRANRAARQLQRQVNQAEYYSQQTWQQLSPWIEQNRVAPLARTADAVRDTVRETADALTARRDGQFGYRDRDPGNAWFYDYYTYTPTYYTYDADDRYSAAIRYFDNDGDGVYDSRANFTDSDNDGRYDEYQRYDFYTQTEAAVDADVKSDSDDFFAGPEDARRYTATGEIVATKKATVNGSENLVVQIKRNEDQTLVADLGPVDSLRGEAIEVGSTLSVSGAMERIGDKNVLIAEGFRLRGGATVEVDRNIGTPLSGQIVDVKTSTVDNSDHYFAIVESQGERHLVDLGPTTSYKMELAPATEITVRGIPVRVQQNHVMMATRVRVGGQTIQINQQTSLR
ncbi:MAG: hypothetical protein F9B45_07225 [Phycisphaera sp. RhM]|nr:hypothetical protein [Phycisphaera sp. RhM]